jgi:hypothetical protein
MNCEVDLGINGHYRSIVNAITTEYMKALDGYQPINNFNEKTSFEICMFGMREKYMTIDQHNVLYRIGERDRYRKTKCVRCRLWCSATDDKVDACILCDEQREWAKACEY